MKEPMWKLARPGIVRVPWLYQGGNHIIVALDRNRRLVQAVRVFSEEDEARWGRYLDTRLDELEGGRP